MMKSAAFVKTRRAMGMSQKDVAGLLGVPLAHVKRIEDGRVKAVPVVVARLMHAFQAGYRPHGEPG